MELSRQVYDICCRKQDPSVELKAFLDAHAEVSVNQYRDDQGNHALHEASFWGHAACVRMLLDRGADVHAQLIPRHVIVHGVIGRTQKELWR